MIDHITECILPYLVYLFSQAIAFFNHFINSMLNLSEYSFVHLFQGRNLKQKEIIDDFLTLLNYMRIHNIINILDQKVDPLIRPLLVNEPRFNFLIMPIF